MAVLFLFGLIDLVAGILLGIMSYTQPSPVAILAAIMIIKGILSMAWDS